MYCPLFIEQKVIASGKGLVTGNHHIIAYDYVMDIFRTPCPEEFCAWGVRCAFWRVFTIFFSGVDLVLS